MTKTPRTTSEPESESPSRPQSGMTLLEILPNPADIEKATDEELQAYIDALKAHYTE